MGDPGCATRSARRILTGRRCCWIASWQTNSTWPLTGAMTSAWSGPAPTDPVRGQDRLSEVEQAKLRVRDGDVDGVAAAVLSRRRPDAGVVRGRRRGRGGSAAR